MENADAVVLVGYPLTRHSIRPFADYDLTNDPTESRRRKKWNQKLSSLRIYVEHAFGRLKGRFPYLREISGYDMDKIYKFIEALLVVHNVLTLLDDNPQAIEDYIENPEPADRDLAADVPRGRASRETAFRMGMLRRKQLLNLVM